MSLPQPPGSLPNRAADDSPRPGDPLQLLTDAALSHGDVMAMVPGVLARIRDFFQADTAALLLADEAGKTLSVSAAVGVLEQERGRGVQVKIGDGVAGRIAAERQPVALETLADHPVASPRLRELVQSLVGVPLVVDSRLLGVLLVGSVAARRFSGPETHQLQTLAERFALALDHARLYQAERTARTHAALAERRLRRAEQEATRLASIVEGSEDAIIAKDLNATILSWNFGAQRMYGYTAEEAVGQHISLLTPGHRREEIDDIMRKLVRGERISHLETQRQRKDGEIIDVALTISPIRDATRKRIVGASTIAREISDLKRAERTLRTTEKLAATGRLAASIAHEINNPMASVTNLLYLLQHHPNLDPTATEYVRLAQEELQRVTHIVRQMLGFYRESETPILVNLKDVVENVLLLYARRLQNTGIRVVNNFHTDASIRGFPGEIRQVFSNLIVNSIEALGERGRIRIDARRSRDWANPLVEGVRVLIADDGPGIPEAARRRIFEPFFTTKGERGTGLGLWVSEGIVRKHGGTVRVRSSVSARHHGTCFSIFFPVEAVRLEKVA